MSSTTGTSRRIEVIEVGPRDGLQNEAKVLPPEVRAEFIHRLQDAGARRIEVTSFVNPARVPQMGEAERLVSLLVRSPGASYIGLVLNDRGFDRAVEAGMDEINYAFAATDVFNQMNTRMTTGESLRMWEGLAARGRDAGVRMTLTIGVAFGCHFGGEVAVDHVVRLARRAVEAGAEELAVADTIGVAVPTQIEELLTALQRELPGTPLRLHLHNTRNTGFANAAAAIRVGVTTLDASSGGIGGCPFAPNAAGNIGTEDLTYMVERMGLETGLSLPALIETASWIEGHLGHQITAMLGRAGVFPAGAAAESGAPAVSDEDVAAVCIP